MDEKWSLCAWAEMVMSSAGTAAAISEKERTRKSVNGRGIPQMMAQAAGLSTREFVRGHITSLEDTKLRDENAAMSLVYEKKAG